MTLLASVSNSNHEIRPQHGTKIHFQKIVHRRPLIQRGFFIRKLSAITNSHRYHAAAPYAPKPVPASVVTWSPQSLTLDGYQRML